MRFRVQIESVFPAVDILTGYSCPPAFLVGNQSLIRGYLGAWEMMSLPGRVKSPVSNPTCTPVGYYNKIRTYV